ncbi:hypothetical protein M3Y95_01285000 [Aphelenchoides besseyi]|nr:hypothetical protein M3Y95_01285000 [Aphelenchoides besseyi]
MNVTSVDINSELFQRILTINYGFSTSIGIVANSSLIFLILKCSPTSLKPYRPVLLTAALIDGFALFVSSVGQIQYRPVNNVNLILLKGPAKHLPAFGQWVVYSLLIVSILLEVLVVLLENIFRYRFLKTRSALPRTQLIFMIIFVVLLSSIQLPFYLSTYENIDFDNQQLWPQDDPNTIIFMMNTRKSTTLVVISAYRIFVTMIPFILSVIIAVMSVCVMRKEVSKMSKKTKELMSQFNNTLLTRMLFFGITLIGPQVYVQVAIRNSWSTDVSRFFFMILSLWFPTTNSILSIVFIRTYRETILRVFYFRFPNFRSSFQTSTTRIRTVS